MPQKVNSVHFEWSIAEEGTVWSEATLLTPWPLQGNAAAWTQPAVPQVTPLALPTTPLFPVIVLLLIALLTGASVPWPPQDEVLRLQRQIEAALQREERVWRHNNIALFRNLLDSQARLEWRTDWSMPWGIQPDQRIQLGARITAIEAHGDLLWVHTQISQPMTAWWRAAPFSELRFYRHTRNGWIRTSPMIDAWGEVRTLATPHLRFQFYERDTSTILALSTRVELAYLQLYQLLGRSPPPTPITLSFVVVPDQMREFRMGEEPLRFSSPALLKAPLELSAAEYTAHLAISHLADRALIDLLGYNSRQYANRWRTLFWGAAGRLRIEVLGERSPWQQEAAAFFRQTDLGQRPLRFTDIDDRYTGQNVPREAYLWEYMAAEALIDYVVQRYGWQGVSALFGGLGQSSYWSKVIPSVFHQPVSDLETDWNRYLAETYLAPN